MNEFFGTLYRKAENVALPDDCIENFLGVDLHHSVVMGSKLSENVGTVIPFTERQYIEMEDIIHRFAGGNLRLAKKRTFLPVENGILGLFGLENFITAQKTSWIRRCKNIDQDWKKILIKSGSGNITFITGTNIDKEKFPVLHTIWMCYDKFRVKFTGTENNFLSAHLVNNSALTIGERSRNCLMISDAVSQNRQDPDPDLVPVQQQPNIVTILKNLKINDLMDGDSFINKATFQRECRCWNCGRSVAQN
jgi:hypothetical protein